MIRLYTAGTPNGRKASIALEELGLEYEVIRLDLQAEDQLKPEFLAMNPNHKIPVIDDDGLIVWESGAILLYLAEKYGGLLPKDEKGRYEAIQQAFFQTGGIGPNLGRFAAAIRKPEEERNPEMIQIFGDEVKRLLGVFNTILSDGREYVAGEFSIGDIMHYGWLSPLYGLKAPQIMELPHVVAWMERMGQRPGVIRGMAVPE